MRVMLLVVMGLLALPASAEEISALLQLEAWCDGGIDGRYQHATVDVDGAIRATKDRSAAKPWPVVATEPVLAEGWFAAVAAAAPAEPVADDGPPITDGIECGLQLHDGQESVSYNLPDVLSELVRYVPNYH